MDLMEYKAKELFAAGGLPVQKFAHIGAVSYTHLTLPTNSRV